MKQYSLKYIHLNTNIHLYLKTPDGQSSNLYLNAVHFFK
jgi:hypothetical protein